MANDPPEGWEFPVRLPESQEHVSNIINNLMGMMEDAPVEEAIDTFQAMSEAIRQVAIPQLEGQAIDEDEGPASSSPTQPDFSDFSGFSDEDEEEEEEEEEEKSSDEDDASDDTPPALIRLPVDISSNYDINSVESLLQVIVADIATTKIDVKKSSRVVTREIGAEPAYRIVTLIMKDMIGGTIPRLVAISKQIATFRNLIKSDELTEKRELPATIRKLFKHIHMAVYFDTEDTDVRGIMRAYTLCVIRRAWTIIKDELDSAGDNEVKQWLSEEAIRLNMPRARGVTNVSHAKAVLVVRLFHCHSSTQRHQASKKFNDLMEDGKLPETFVKYWGEGSCVFFSYDHTTSKARHLLPTSAYEVVVGKINEEFGEVLVRICRRALKEVVVPVMEGRAISSTLNFMEEGFEQQEGCNILLALSEH